jgi:hypothetical protein
VPITPKKAMLLGTLRVMGEAVPNDQGAVIYPEAHAAAGQDQRLMGLSRRSAESALVGAASQPIGGAFGPGKIVWSQRVTKCFARHPDHCRSVAPLISLLNPNGIGLSEMAVRQKPKRLIPFEEAVWRFAPRRLGQQFGRAQASC